MAAANVLIFQSDNSNYSVYIGSDSGSYLIIDALSFTVETS